MRTLKSPSIMSISYWHRTGNAYHHISTKNLESSSRFPPVPSKITPLSYHRYTGHLKHWEKIEKKKKHTQICACLDIKDSPLDELLLQSSWTRTLVFSFARFAMLPHCFGNCRYLYWLKWNAAMIWLTRCKNCRTKRKKKCNTNNCRGYCISYLF